MEYFFLLKNYNKIQINNNANNEKKVCLKKYQSFKFILLFLYIIFIFPFFIKIKIKIII
jgi:hypothetical protein